MDALHNWIVAVAAASIAVAAIGALTPDGRGRRVLKLAGGAAVLLVVCMPIAQIDFDNFSIENFAFSEDIAAETAQIERSNYVLIESVITARVGAYISDKAAQLGLETEVAVAAEPTDGTPLPASLEGVWSGDPAALDELQALIETDLGIPAARQVWTEKSDEKG